MPAVIACGYYFEKRRALATGISVCGSGKLRLRKVRLVSVTFGWVVLD